MTNVDFVEILKKVRIKAQSSSNTQQLLDYIDGQIDLLTMMSGATAVEPKPVDCDPKIFLETLGESTGAVQVKPSTVTCRFHGAEFTSHDL